MGQWDAVVTALIGRESASERTCEPSPRAAPDVAICGIAGVERERGEELRNTQKRQPHACAFM